MRITQIGCCAAVLAAGMVADRAPADVVMLGSARDNTLYEHEFGQLSNGAGEHFFAGRTAVGLLRRGLIMFDLGSIPQDAVVNSVTLTLHMSMTAIGPLEVSLHRVLGAWGEGTSDALGGEGGGAAATLGDATWLHASFDTTLWTNPGGDFVQAASAAAMVDQAGFYSWSTPQLMMDVQSWISGGKANHGWLLRGDEAALGTTKRFDTRENMNSAMRPVLIVDYTIIPAPASVPAIGAVMALAAIAGRRRRRAP